MLPFRPQLDPDIGHGHHVADGQVFDTTTVPVDTPTTNPLDMLVNTSGHQSISEDGSVTADGASPPRRNNNNNMGTRSRRGCWTCRDKKAKKRCDEDRPACGRCRRMNLVCDYTPRPSLAERRRQQALVEAQQRAHNNHHQQAHLFGPVEAGMQTNHHHEHQPQQYHHHHHHYQHQQHQQHQQQQYLQLHHPPHRRRHNHHLSPSHYASSNSGSDPASPLAVMRLSTVGEVGASSIPLGPREHEAIRFFRTVFAKAHHTKNPDYSLFTIMFRIAQDDPMVMHMILSLGGRAMDLHRPSSATAAVTSSPSVSEQQRPYSPHLNHYSAALRCMADTVGLEPGAAAFDMDAILTALWLMCIYEQKFGDPRCQGYANHLMGAASLLQHQQKSLRKLRPPHLDDGDDDGDNGEYAGDFDEERAEPTALVRQIPEHRRHLRLSLYSARILVWLSLHDSAAATSGVGGHLNTTMYRILRNHDADKTQPHGSSRASPNNSTQRQPSSPSQQNGSNNSNFLSTIFPTIPSNPIDTFRDLYKYSNPLYRAMWGDAYPQAELLDDVENRAVFGFLANTNQLRFLVAQLAEYDQDRHNEHQNNNDNNDHERRGVGGRSRDDFSARAAQVDAEIRRVGYESTELLEVASGLSAETDNSHRLVTNIRTIVPLYYAVILDFLRVVDLHEHSSTRATTSGTDLLDENTPAPARAALEQRNARQHHQHHQHQHRERRRQRALSEIMNLARQAHRHGGDELLTKIAWPLFAAALELPPASSLSSTSSSSSSSREGDEGGVDRMPQHHHHRHHHHHRAWVLQRFAALAACGDNFARARRFLEERFLPLQDGLRSRAGTATAAVVVDWRRVMRDSGEVFILGI
ncbi:transcriptional activator protein UGA3 [Microdochium nivale]|nr:transcriptional activator protein UGA3 [Microdochium nivale]